MATMADKYIIVFVLLVLQLFGGIFYISHRTIPQRADTATERELPMSRVWEFCRRTQRREEHTCTADVDCCRKSDNFAVGVRGNFRVLYNCIVPSRTARCNQSVTVATNADLPFFDNVVPLVERWRGPISLALHAPGTDFYLVLAAVHYARECLTPLIRDHVTFHIYFDVTHTPRDVVWTADVNCSMPPPWENVSRRDLYRGRNGVLYPVNVGRNIARETVLTHFVLSLDIELYPSPGVIDDFLGMVHRGDFLSTTTKPKVFVLPVFEVEKGMHVPGNKTELVTMLRKGTAIWFHKFTCPPCHDIPHAEMWTRRKVTPDLRVFAVGKRIGILERWEPFYIGTNNDPWYDERLSWEGGCSKKPQAFAMCLLDYEFLVLNNAFLVHKPGIKYVIDIPERTMVGVKSRRLIWKSIQPELIAKYRRRKFCNLWAI